MKNLLLLTLFLAVFGCEQKMDKMSEKKNSHYHTATVELSSEVDAYIKKSLEEDHRKEEESVKIKSTSCKLIP